MWQSANMHNNILSFEQDMSYERSLWKWNITAFAVYAHDAAAIPQSPAEVDKKP